MAEPTQDDAWALAQRTFADAGLSDLLPQLKEWIYQGVGQNELDLRVRETEAYKKRTAVNVLRKERGLAPLSLGEIVSTEASIKQVMREAGLPAGFYDSPDDFNNIIGRDVSASELQSRVKLASNASYSMDPTVRNELVSRYGLDAGHLTAYYLDPDRAMPILDRQQKAATVAAEATRRQVSIGTDLAESLTDRGIGAQEAAQGFEAVSRQAGLGSGPGEVVSAAELLKGAFDGGEAAAKVKRVTDSRLAQYSGGGGVADSQQGITGLGRG